MSETTVGTAVALGSIGAGISALALVQYLSRYREKPGAGWFMLALGGQAIWCLGYGVGLLVSDSAVRSAFEAIMWIGMAWTGPLFLAFGLAYTGRGGLIRTNSFRALLAVPAVTTVLAVTHPFHELLWAEFRSTPVFELSTVSYAIQPWGYGTIAVGIVCVSVGVLLLVETMISYGPLYRRETAAVALSTVLPSVGLLVWLLGVGPYPELNLAPLLFLPHVALDAYAFVGTGMFESNPTTRRTADRTAIDDVPVPIVIVDTEGRIVELNDEAETLVGATTAELLGTPLTDCLGITLDDDGWPTEPVQTLTPQTRGRSRTFSISSAALVEPGGRTVGRTLTLQEITTELEREQRLSVLHRVLRHNLRNELTVIMGAVDVVRSAIDDGHAESWLDRLESSGRTLDELGDRVRELTRLRERDPKFESIAADELVEAVTADVTDESPDATIDTEIGDAVLSTDREILETVLVNLLRNAVEYGESDPAWASVRGTDADDGRYTIEIEDDGSGIPEMELEALDDGPERALEHGSGLGLWVVTWGVDAIDGEVAFDSTDDGTTASVRVPTE